MNSRIHVGFVRQERSNYLMVNRSLKFSMGIVKKFLQLPSDSKNFHGT